MKKTCPLCSTTAEITPHSGWSRYDCPTCGSFEISSSEEDVCLAKPAAAQAHREHIANQRKNGITITRIGLPIT